MRSLRLRLFAMIVATTVLIWSAASAWVFLHTRVEIQRVLDRRLVEAATMVSSLAREGGPLTGTAALSLRPEPTYSRQLSCQIWSISGRLIARSSGAPGEPLAVGGTGMSERDIGGERWRIYTLVDASRGVRVSVGDNLGVRRRLIRDLMTGLLLPAIAGLAALSVLIWAVVGRGLRPLHDVTMVLRRRDAADFSPLEIDSRSTEVSPLIDAVDSRSRQLAHLRDAERHFIASAAHELQTPLAGLKTHAQVATRTNDPAILKRSLHSISQSVDRTARLVRQLLDLARAEGRVAEQAAWVDLGNAARAVATEFGSEADGVTIRVDPSLIGARAQADETELLLVLRNLVSNAVAHSPRGSEISLSLASEGDRFGLVVEDEGSGIPDVELERVRERFVRGSQARGHGSGLGLSIVEMIAAREGGNLELGNVQPSGLRAIYWFRRADRPGGTG